MPKNRDSSFGMNTTPKSKSKAVAPKRNIFGNIKKNQPQTEAQKKMAASQAGKNYRKNPVRGNGLSSGTNCLSVSNDRGTAMPNVNRGSTGCEGRTNASSTQNGQRNKRKK